MVHITKDNRCSSHFRLCPFLISGCCHFGVFIVQHDCLHIPITMLPIFYTRSPTSLGVDTQFIGLCSLCDEPTTKFLWVGCITSCFKFLATLTATFFVCCSIPFDAHEAYYALCLAAERALCRGPCAHLVQHQQYKFCFCMRRCSIAYAHACLVPAVLSLGAMLRSLSMHVTCVLCNCCTL